MHSTQDYSLCPCQAGMQYIQYYTGYSTSYLQGEGSLLVVVDEMREADDVLHKGHRIILHTDHTVLCAWTLFGHIWWLKIANLCEAAD